ncbi:Hypothetical predicted protein [Paramuricea clavata]|uniref:Uncharacterized protein n=1 Tax=Paramuricea clavata TaxID=317549 RepID=A0A6S7JNC9_PARCT|nr:Hypothetical predicted protein [Paramuricea clavata]
MSNATKRKAENEKILQKEANTCKRITSFFSKATGECNQSHIPNRVPNSENVQEADISEWVPSSEDVQEEFTSDSPMGAESLSTCDQFQDKDSVGNCTTVNSDTSTISSVVPESSLGPSLENDETCRETCQESNQRCQVYLYRGYPLNINAIVKKAGPGVLYLYKEKSKTRSANQEKNKTRSFVKCLVCAEYEEEAKRFSTNHQVYLAYGVRCDGKKKMQDVVDHLLGAAYDAAIKLKNLSTQWATKAPNHPWLRTLKNHDSSVIRTLTHMAVESITTANC